MNKDKEQLMDWYNQGYGRVAFRHGLSEPIMREWLKANGYYDTEQGSELAERMLGEFQAELIGYELSCLDPIQASVLLLLLSDYDKDQDQIAEQINTVCFDVIYHVIDLSDNDGTGLYQLSMTIVDETELDHEQIMDYLDQRVTELSEHESKLLELLASPQQQPRAYYFGLIDLYRALD